MLHTGGQIIDQNNFAKLFNEHTFFMAIYYAEMKNSESVWIYNS